MPTQIQNFYKATITRNWSSTTGDFNVSVAPTVSSGYVVVSPNNSTLREIVKYTATGTNSYGPFITVSNLADRGIGGTTAQTHSIGESVRMNITAEHWQEMQDDINSIIAAGLPAGSEGDIMYNDGANWVASSTLPSDRLLTKTVTLSAAQILALNTTPVELIASPGAGKTISLDEIVGYLDAGGTAFANGNVVSPVWSGGTANIFGTASTAYFPATFINSATDTIQRICQLTAAPAMQSDKAINLYTGTAFINGTGTLKLFIKYRILTL